MKDHGIRRRSEERSRRRNQNLETDNYFNSTFTICSQKLLDNENISRPGNAHFCAVSGHTSPVLSSIVDVNVLMVNKGSNHTSRTKAICSSD